MFGIGPQELILLAVAALIIFGPQRLPEIAAQVGKAIRDFRRMSDDLTGEFQRSMALDEPPPAQQPLLTSETIQPNSTPNGISDTIADSLRVETVPSDADDAPAAQAEPGDDATADTAADTAATGGQDTVISLTPVATPALATKAEPLVGVSQLDAASPYVAERTDRLTGMVVAAVATTEEVAPAPTAESPAESAPAAVDPIADAWDAVINTEATLTPQVIEDDEAASQATDGSVATIADGALPGADTEAAEALVAESVVTGGEVTTASLPIPEGYAYPPNTYQSGPIAFSEPTRVKIDPEAEVTIREKIESQVAAEAFRERRRIAHYQRARRKD